LTPQDEFVGFFIGSPGMNFLDGKVNDGAVMVGSTRIGTTLSATTIANGNVRVGIRPEFLSIDVAGKGLPVEINRVEHRGGYKLVHADSAQGKFVAKLDNESALVAGQNVHLAFHPERTYLFRDSKVCGTVNVKGAK
jgi:glycerol transport system ATP-binding protein